MRCFGTTALACGLLLLAANSALSQPPRGQLPPGGLGGFGGPAMLLSNRSVQEELKLDKDQLERLAPVLKKAMETSQEQFAKLRDATPEERREKIQEMMKEISQEVRKGSAHILTADQHKRLRQIERQEEGIAAFHDPEVQKALNLTAEQKDKLKTIAEDTRREMEEVRKTLRGNFREGFQKLGIIRKESMDRAASVLNAEQTKTWKQLTGEPFELKFEFRPVEGRPSPPKKGV